MHTGVNNHGQSIRKNSGTTAAMHPVLGSWLTYGLGGETNSLPPYVALIDPGQLPVDGVEIGITVICLGLSGDGHSTN